MITNITSMALSAVLLTACGGGSATTADSNTPITENEITSVPVETAPNEITSVPATITPTSGRLSTAEVGSLLFMREEEELARDLYLDIYAAKDNRLNVFKNISDNAETRHAEAMLVLLNTYGIEDPSTGQHNTYTSLELQNLYNQLLSDAIGSDDLAALRVGALVEETDIQDIVNDMTLISADHQDILATYNNLLCGSKNHLRSFVKQIERTSGQAYVIQVPEIADEINAVLNSPQGQCGQ